MKTKVFSLLLPFLAISAFFGCSTPVTVTTDPPGATIYCRGAGRPAYKWTYRGATTDGQPVIFKVPYNAIKTMAVWPAKDGQPAVKSDIIYTKILFNENPVITIRKSK